MAKSEKNCEPDIKKGLDIAKNIKDLKKQIKDDADKRKIDGFNPGDLLNNSGSSTNE